MWFLYIIGICIVLSIFSWAVERINELTSSWKYKNENEELKNYIPELEKKLKKEYEKNIEKLNLLEKQIEFEKQKEITQCNILEKEKEILISLSNYELNSDMLKFYKEYINKRVDGYVNYFLYKKYPSKKSAEYLKSIKKEFKETVAENKNLKLKLLKFSDELEILEKEERREEVKEQEEKNIKEFQKIDWGNLSDVEKIKYLDEKLIKYKERKKSKLKIGLEFERYCGFLFEEKNYKVYYNGILKGKADEGIDLIAKKDNKTIYIQCKYWSITKQIRENAIAQLLGASLKKSIEIGLDSNEFMKLVKEKKIEMWLISKTSLSKEAKEFAKLLNIQFKENLGIDFDYPMVKLVEDKEKIFYLPNDLLYDKIVNTSTSKKYLRVDSCKKAYEMGYRHCYKWKGTS